VKTYKGRITELKDDEVFVFGANVAGFHGAGSAGFATFGEPGNVWRNYNYDAWPAGSKGRWTVKGRTGPMVGTQGKGYGLPTVTRCGAKRSLRIDFRPLFECCARNPGWTFYFAQEGRVGLNGWTPSEIAEMAAEAGPWPDNLVVSESFAPFLKAANRLDPGT